MRTVRTVPQTCTETTTLDSGEVVTCNRPGVHVEHFYRSTSGPIHQWLTPGRTYSEVVIYRDKEYPTPGRPTMYAWKWFYSYAVDGTQKESWGNSLVETRAHIKRRYPGAKIVEPWKQQTA